MTTSGDTASHKQCTVCRLIKPLTKFHRRKIATDGRRSECAACSVAATAAWKAANAERVQATEHARVRDRSADIERTRAWRQTPEGKTAMRRHRLKADHGITPDEYDAMLIKQDGLCGICTRPPPEGQMLDVDHNHATGQRRKLLCRPCNTAIGLLGEDVDRILAAAYYLRKHTVAA